MTRLRQKLGTIVVGFSLCSSLGVQLVGQGIQLEIGQNFTGSTFGVDSEASPADANGAAGPQHFVEFINGRFSVYKKSDGTRLKTMTDLQFWRAAGITFSSSVGVSDPRIVFDFDSQRWFVSMIDVNINSPRQRSNHFLLSVSATDDPTGSWHGFTFAADTNNVNFADFPTLGIDHSGVYLSGDMFDRLSNPLGPTVVSIPKSSLLATPAGIDGMQVLGPLTYSSRGDILQPAITIGTASTAEPVVAAGDLGIDFNTGRPNGAHTTLVLSSILNGSTTNASLSSPPVVLTVPPYTVPIDPTQPDGSSNLADNDARIAAAVRRVGDVVYATHAVESANHAAIRWYKINAVSNTLLQSGIITDPVLDLFYPSIAANEAGTVVIGCNGSSATNFVSSYATAGTMTNGSLVFGPLLLLKAGSASYQNPDVTGESRWGDYSATTVDPTDPTRFWTIQMIAVDSGAWATQITELLTGGATTSGPQLSVQRAGTNVFVSWPASPGSNFQLLSSPTLGPGTIWSPVNQTPSVTNNVDSVLLPAVGPAEFLRLTNSPAPPTG